MSQGEQVRIGFKSENVQVLGAGVGVTTHAGMFPREGYHMVTTCESSELESTLDHVDLRRTDITPQEVTGLLVRVGEGDFSEVWVCAQARAWLTSSVYTRVA